MSNTPNYPAMKLLQLAMDSLRAGRLAEAEARFHTVLGHDPDNAAALHQLGMFAYQRGNRAEAEDHFERGLVAEPNHLPLLSSYGQLLHEKSEPRAALRAFLKALAVDSSQPELWNSAGICFQETGQPTKAIEFYLRALSLHPDYPEALNNLGVVMIAENDLDGAIEHLRRALALNPAYADCYTNLGVALRGRHNYTEAIAAFREAARLRPNDANATAALGEALSLIYDAEAEPTLRRALALRPDDPEKHWNLALELLKQGKYGEGWQHFERRWQRPLNQVPLPAFTQPYWRGAAGEELRGRTILLHAEQGFGDTIQFLRYVPLVLSRGARVVLQVQPALQRLVESYAAQFGGAVSVLRAGEPMPVFDWHCPLISLPAAFATTLETIRSPLRLIPNAESLPSSFPPRPFRVGVAWAGNQSHVRDRERTIPFSALHPLFCSEHCTFVSLQVGPAVADLQHASREVEQPALADFLDTATVIDTLDLVIAVDTAVAHLAASQGIPTWILLPFVADWRWLKPTASTGEHITNPWYPQARIFRQAKLPDGEPMNDLWQPVIAEVAQALAMLARASGESALAEARPSTALP